MKQHCIVVRTDGTHFFISAAKTPPGLEIRAYGSGEYFALKLMQWFEGIKQKLDPSNDKTYQAGAGE